MSSALDRLAALAAGTAPVVTLRPRARFEGPAPPARVGEAVAPSSALLAELPAPASVEQVVLAPEPAVEPAVEPASAVPQRTRAVEYESATIHTDR